jgi:hypothetical protein
MKTLIILTDDDGDLLWDWVLGSKAYAFGLQEEDGQYRSIYSTEVNDFCGKTIEDPTVRQKATNFINCYRRGDHSENPDPQWVNRLDWLKVQSVAANLRDKAVEWNDLLAQGFAEIQGKRRSETIPNADCSGYETVTTYAPNHWEMSNGLNVFKFPEVESVLELDLIVQDLIKTEWEKAEGCRGLSRILGFSVDSISDGYCNYRPQYWMEPSDA